MNKTFLELKDIIDKSQKIIIFSHVNADGDTLGSNLALALMIEEHFKKTPDSVYVGNLPDMYKYLPFYDRFKNVEDIKESDYDLAIAVDVASKDRLVNAVKLYDSTKIKVNIDHHKTNNSYGDINIMEPDSACVGVILYKIFKEWNLNLNLNIAKCIYTSVMTDTGCFKYENTSPEVFNIAAELVKYGVSPCKEYRLCYETKPQNMVQFQADIVSNSKFYNDGKIAFAKVTKEDVLKYQAEDYFTEGIVEILRSSKTVEIAAILKEINDDNTKVSLRSKKVDLTPIVKKYDGGGHSFAAGCTIKKPISIAYNKLLEDIQCVLK